LVAKSIAAINAGLNVAQLVYTTTQGEQQGVEFSIERTETKKLDRAQGGFASYDLIGKIVEGTTLTRRSVAAILMGIDRKKLRLFRGNPEEFISRAADIINKQKATRGGAHKCTPRAEEPYSQDIFTMSRARTSTQGR
jgi:type III restriction enzyme